MKTEKIDNRPGLKLMKINVKNRSLQKEIKYWNIGRQCRKILVDLKTDDPIREGFEICLCDSFESAAIYIQKKFPLNNKCLKYLFAAIDPACHGNTAASTAKKGMTKFFPNVVSESELDLYDVEVDKYHLSSPQPRKMMVC